MEQCSTPPEAIESKDYYFKTQRQGKDLPATHGRSLSKRLVRFQFIQIRHYERILGDHPSCSAGAPIGIGWNYSLVEHLTVEEFEETRTIDERLIPLNKEQRHDLLLAWGVKTNELVCSVRKNLKTKHQRRRTFVNSTTGRDRWEEAVETASRKLKKSLQWTSVFSSDSESLRQAALGTSDTRSFRTDARKSAEWKETRINPPTRSISTAAIPEAASHVMVSTNFDKPVTTKAPSVSNAQRPIRPPASPYKTVLKHPDDSNSRDSFSRIVLDVTTGSFDISAGSRSKYEGSEEEDAIISIFDDSSSSSTEYADSEEENYVSISNNKAIDTRSTP